MPTSGRKSQPVQPQVRRLLGLGDWLVAETDTGDRYLHHMAPPICHARLLAQAEYRLDMGEVFLGPADFCLINLVWPDGEPDDDVVLALMAGAAALGPWDQWTPMEVPVSLRSCHVSQFHTQ